ncbi:hypothetical protein ACFQYP_33540 [Nonomuraea antimicrobica]
MTVREDITLSVVIMHHPARRDALPSLLAACDPLPVRVVEDPDPGGPPSPLRTAKRAWAAVAEGATHHVVLQDDAVPVHGFAAQLARAVAARPGDGVTLSVQQTSPRNSYAVRRAALAGQAWAPMSVVEWTPTLGLALPAAEARALAAYFSEFPDELLEDDDFVTPFCVARGLRVFATVPNLVEHAGLPSLSGYEAEGHRPVTVYEPRWLIPQDHWSDPARGLAPALAETGRGTSPSSCASPGAGCASSARAPTSRWNTPTPGTGTIGPRSPASMASAWCPRGNAPSRSPSGVVTPATSCTRECPASPSKYGPRRSSRVPCRPGSPPRSAAPSSRRWFGAAPWRPCSTRACRRRTGRR